MYRGRNGTSGTGHRSFTRSGYIRELELASRSELNELEEFPRPATRGECPPRPCPYVSCRHHLYIEVNPLTGAVQFPFGALEIDQMPATCSLDMADDGPLTLDDIGRLTNRTKERIRQIETRALLVLKASGISPSMLHPRMADWMDVL